MESPIKNLLQRKKKNYFRYKQYWVLVLVDLAGFQLLLLGSFVKAIKLYNQQNLLIFIFMSFKNIFFYLELNSILGNV